MSTSNRACIITGASSGLGRAVALAFAAAGYHCVLVGRNATALAAVGDKLRRSAGSATEVVCDVGRPEDLRRFESSLRELGRPIDVVVAGAGQAAGTGFLAPDASLEAWRDMVLTNVFGVAATARLTLPHLVQSRGCLFLIGSVVGRSVVPGDLYSATKHAVSAMAEALRLEVQDRGVMVSVVQPGLLDTPMVTGARRLRPMMDPADVAAELLRLARAERRFDVHEIVLRARPKGEG